LRHLWDRVTFAAGVTALGVGASLIGASPAFQDRSHWKALFFRGGIVCCVLGAALIALLFLARPLEKLGSGIIRFGHYEYVISYASNDHIAEIVEFGCSSVGAENHITEAELAEHVAVNGKIITRLDRVSSNGRRKLVGYYVLLPLKKDIAQRITKGQLVSGKQIRAEDLSRRFHQASALYIGVVVGSSRHDRAVIIRELKQKISHLVISRGRTGRFKRSSRDRARNKVNSR
jgi:hypothetical protein